MKLWLAIVPLKYDVYGVSDSPEEAVRLACTFAAKVLRDSGWKYTGAQIEEEFGYSMTLLQNGKQGYIGEDY